MAMARSLALLVSFLTIQQITATATNTSIPTPEPPTLITMHVGPPVTVTQQSQTVTSHVPVLTVCPFGAHLHHNASCSTSYRPTITPICSTTLSPLAAPKIPITACDQNVTFSTDHGFKPVPASGERGFHALMRRRQEVTSSVETLTTYYVAPWTDLSAGAVPTGPVQAVVCSAEGCTTHLEAWGTQAREVTLTSTQTVQFQAQITGHANVIVGPDNATTIAVSASKGTTISYSTVVQATQTSISISIVKSAVAAGVVGPPAVSDIAVAVPGEGGIVAGAGVTTTISTTYTRTMTLISASGGASVSANGTVGISFK